LVAVVLFLISSNSFAEKNQNCLARDENGNIVYNVKGNGRGCRLMRPIHNYERNIMTEKGMESLIGKSCEIPMFANADGGGSGKIRSGNSHDVKCKDGYFGNVTRRSSIEVSCEDGEMTYEDVKCRLFNGFVEYSQAGAHLFNPNDYGLDDGDLVMLEV
jgi:hypothetical protein